MDKAVKITSIIIGGIVLIALIAVYAFIQLAPTNTLTATGESEIDVEPELVHLNLVIETINDSAQEARDKNAELLDDLIISLIKLGYDREDIETEQFSVNPEYEWDNGRELVGYKARHAISLKVDVGEDIGDAIDAGVDAGAYVNYINYELTKETENQYKAEAIKLATQDARNKAEAMADGLNAHLSGIYQVRNSNFYYHPWTVYSYTGMEDNALEAKQATTSIQPSDRQISARIEVVYKLR
ncbi:MAG: SIMPL domain-containing protein [Candidatus Nanoarchaeia archaeon]